MADYRPDWEPRTVQTSREYFEKHPSDLTSKELNMLYKFIAMENRLAKVDRFLWSLK